MDGYFYFTATAPVDILALLRKQQPLRVHLKDGGDRNIRFLGVLMEDGSGQSWMFRGLVPATVMRGGSIVGRVPVTGFLNERTGHGYFMEAEGQDAMTSSFSVNRQPVKAAAGSFHDGSGKPV